jgi:hypothetical protein
MTHEPRGAEDEGGLPALGFVAFPEALDNPDWGSGPRRRRRWPIVLAGCLAGAALVTTVTVLAFASSSSGAKPTAAVTITTGPRSTVYATVTASATKPAAAATKHASPTTTRPAPAPSTTHPVVMPPVQTVTQPALQPATSAAPPPSPPVNHMATSSTSSSLTCSGPATMTVTAGGGSPNTLTFSWPGGQKTFTSDQVDYTVSAGAGTYSASDTGVAPHVSIRQVGGSGECS